MLVGVIATTSACKRDEERQPSPSPPTGAPPGAKVTPVSPSTEAPRERTVTLDVAVAAARQVKPNAARVEALTHVAEAVHAEGRGALAAELLLEVEGLVKPMSPRSAAIGLMRLARASHRLGRPASAFAAVALHKVNALPERRRRSARVVLATEACRAGALATLSAAFQDDVGRLRALRGLLEDGELGCATELVGALPPRDALEARLAIARAATARGDDPGPQLAAALAGAPDLVSRARIQLHAIALQPSAAGHAAVTDALLSQVQSTSGAVPEARAWMAAVLALSGRSSSAAALVDALLLGPVPSDAMAGLVAALTSMSQASRAGAIARKRAPEGAAALLSEVAVTLAGLGQAEPAIALASELGDPALRSTAQSDVLIELARARRFDVVGQRLTLPADADDRDWLAVQAARAAIGAGDIKAATRFVNQVTDPIARAALGGPIKARIAAGLAKKGDCEAAARLTKGLRRSVDRARGLLAVVRHCSLPPGERPAD